MDDMQYSISFLLLKVENRLIHYSYEKVAHPINQGENSLIL